MSNSILLLFFLILFCISSSSSVNTTHKCSVQQSLALRLFKQNLSSINFSIDGTYWLGSGYTPCSDWLGSGYTPVMMNWNTSSDCCDWNGVTCDPSTGDVIGLDLSCGMLQGTIHPNTTLFHLPRLQKLNLAYNNFTSSQLPPNISSRLSNTLTHLNISNCGFTGQVPTDISHLHKLVSLDLSYNYIDLEPHVFINLLQNLTVMKELSLEGVYISSVLPTNLNLSSSLRLINLRHTGLQGTLPHNLFNLQSLENLDLSGNSFTGHIPSEISLLPKLVSLDLSSDWNDNLLIQPHIFSSLLVNSTFLRDLWLDYVNIGFGLPDNISSSSSLRSLSLQSTRLQGKLPDNIFNLKYLEELELSGNTNLSGPLPKVNTSTSSIPLWRLDLSNTSLSGEIPTSIGHLKSLVYLDISDCGLNGSLPESLSNLSNLTFLYLSSNNLSGTLPASLFTLPFLTYIRLGNNRFQGNIPIELFSLQSLEDLSLPKVNTSLSGEIPTSIGHLKSLVFLDLSNCGLNGSLPNSLGNLRNLKYLYLSSNKLSGTLPVELFSLQSLKELSLDNNQLTGQIDVLNNGPTLQTFQRLTNLTQLDLSYNNFRGEWELGALLSSLENLDALILSHSGISVTTSNANHYVNPGFEVLSLASCSLKVFPVSIRTMTNLRHLDLSSNDIQEHIPDWIGEIGGNLLLLLNLSNNSIIGTIPNVYDSWSNLQGFIMNGNHLEGKVPASLYKCQNLRIMDLGNNQLNDTFPGWLADLPNLEALVLRSNKFHGGIGTTSRFKSPFKSLRVLDLSHNGFEGQLPTKYFQNFKAMKNVVIQNTKPEYLQMGFKYYYSIIVSMKGEDRYFPQLLVDYTIIDLSNNKFEGEIPYNIGNLKCLKVLNLSHNSLTGRIPRALGKISEIESLDLSWNQLIGEIPQSLADLTSLECLNLSQNHLGGRIPQGKQFNTFDEYSFGGNPKLCGFPLTKTCGEHLQKPQPDGDGDGEEYGFTWKVVVMGYGCGVLLGIVLGCLMLSTGRPKWLNTIADAAEHMIMKRKNKRR